MLWQDNNIRDSKVSGRFKKFIEWFSALWQNGFKRSDLHGEIAALLRYDSRLERAGAVIYSARSKDLSS